MNLKTQKKLAIGVAIAAVVGVGAGVTKLFNHSSDAVTTTTSVPVQKRAPVTTADVQTTTAPRAKDDADQKAEKLAMLQNADVELLGYKGYSFQRRLMPFGRACNNDGTTDASGYHGTSTSISYSVSKDGQDGKICVAHSGKDGVNATVSSFAAAVNNNANTSAPVVQKAAPANALPPQVKAIVSGMNDEKKQKFVAMLNADVAKLRGEDYKIIDLKGQLGRECNADGTTDNAGFKGTASSISYSVSLNGKLGQICMKHSGQIDDLKTKIGSPFVPQ